MLALLVWNKEKKISIAQHFMQRLSLLTILQYDKQVLVTRVSVSDLPSLSGYFLNLFYQQSKAIYKTADQKMIGIAITRYHNCDTTLKKMKIKSFNRIF